MTKLKKKKGSSLVMVLMIASAIMLVGTVAITTISMDVKMRSEENKRIQSLYGADSGLEYVNHLLNKTFEAASIYAQTMITTDGNTRGSSEKDLNDEFQKYFKQYVDLEITEAGKKKITNEFVKSIEDTRYLKYSKESEKEVVDLPFSTETQQSITPPTFEIESYDAKDSNYSITVVSTFQSVEEGINNTRSVSAKFNIDIPEYRGEYESQTIDIFPVFNDKVLTTDGDLEVNKTNTTFDGDVFVVGADSELTDSNMAYDKYRGGIEINSAQANFTKNLITPKTLNVYNSGTTMLNQNLYARNLYVGNVTNDFSQGHVTIEQAAVLDNDLALKATDSSVVISEFYGLNDQTYSEHNPDKQEFVERTSSSIIVNGNENSTISIQDKAYIMGVAYINTLGTKYATGESVAVKGNYLAYTQPLPNTKDNYGFSYYNPLQLVDSKNGQPLTTLQKSEYFKSFYSDQNTPNAGGVTLPNNEDVYTAGAVVYKQGNQVKVEKANYNEAAEGVVTDKQRSYAEEVYAMGYTTQDKDALYDSLGKGTQQTVQSSIDTALLKDKCDKVICVNDDLVLVPANEDNRVKTLVLGSNAVSARYNDEAYISHDALSGHNAKDLEAFIIVDGNVIIDGELNFTGNILATGSVVIQGEVASQTLTYDAVVTHQILAAHFKEINDIFKKEFKMGEQIVNDYIVTEEGQYNPDQYVKQTNWEVVR